MNPLFSKLATANLVKFASTLTSWKIYLSTWKEADTEATVDDYQMLWIIDKFKVSPPLLQRPMENN